MFMSWMLIMPSFKKSLIVEQFQGNYLNLSQNVREGWTNSYWESQMLTLYPLEKKNNSEKPYGGSNPHPLYLRGLMHFTVY